MPISAEAHAERRRANAPPFPRPRGRGPPGCRWDEQVGGWWRADGSRWQFERNVKRKREGKAKMAAWQEEKARRKAVREEAGKENLQYIVRCEFEITDRLRRQAELDDLIDAVKHNGRSIYCEHLREVGQLEDNCGFFPGKYSESEFDAQLLTSNSCFLCDFRRRSSYNISRQPACSHPAHPAQTQSHLQPAVCAQICLL